MRQGKVKNWESIFAYSTISIYKSVLHRILLIESGFLAGVKKKRVWHPLDNDNNIGPFGVFYRKCSNETSHRGAVLALLNEEAKAARVGLSVLWERGSAQARQIGCLYPALNGLLRQRMESALLFFVNFWGLERRWRRGVAGLLPVHVGFVSIDCPEAVEAAHCKSDINLQFGWLERQQQEV